MRGSSQWPTTSLGLVAQLSRMDDRLAWERFLVDYAPPLRALCRGRGLQEADIEDILQAVFLGVSRRIEDFESSRECGRFRSWLSTIALRAIWKLRHRELTRPLVYMDPQALSVLGAQQQGLLEEVNAAITSIAVSQVREEFDELVWNTFCSLWFDGQSASEVARRSGHPIGWVYKAKFRVLRRMTEVVQQLSHDLASI